MRRPRHARASAALLRTIASEKPVVVVSDEPPAHVRIERFARGGADAARWLVAVNMVSEGVDVPRLVVAAYATVKRTDLFFRQAVGRVVRRRAEDPDDLVATVFLPADPALTAAPSASRSSCASRSATISVPPSRSSRRRAWTPHRLPAARRTGAAGGMIVAGIHYARAEVDAARRLLRELGQSERALGRCSSRPPRAGRRPGRAAARAAGSAHRRVEAKRAALDRLAAAGRAAPAIDPQYTWPQAQARVNRAMGVARRSEAGEAQLDDGLAFLRAELDKLAARLSRDAERLRSRPASTRSTVAWRRSTAEADAAGSITADAVRARRATTRPRYVHRERYKPTMLDDKLLEDVSALRARGMSPKEIARTLGPRRRGSAIVRRVAQEESAEQPAHGRVVGCWVSPRLAPRIDRGAPRGLGRHRPRA